MVKSKKGILKEPYNSAYDNEYTDQLRYLGKIISLKIIELGGTEDKKS